MNKKLIAILTLVMFALTLLPMGAFAATTNTALQDVTVGSGQYERLSVLRFAETAATVGSITTGDEVTVTLLNGAKFSHTTPADAVANLQASVTNVATGNAITVNEANDTSFKFTVVSANQATATTFNFDFWRGNAANKVTVDTRSMTGNDVVAMITPSIPSGFTGGEAVLARKVSKSTSSQALSQVDLNVGRSNQALGVVRIQENTSGAITGSITIASRSSDAKLNATTPTASFAGGLDAVAPAAGSWAYTASNADGFSQWTLTITTTSTASGYVQVSGLQMDISEKAVAGEVEVRVTGGGDTTSQNIVVGTAATYGFDFTAGTLRTLYSGNENRSISTFYLEERAQASIIGNGRTLKLTLPSNTAWRVAPTLTIESGDTGFIVGSMTTTNFEDNRRTAVYSLTAKDFTDQKTKIKFASGSVAAKATAAEGDLVITFGGSSNVTGELKVGEIKKPVVVEAADVDVVIGRNNQPIGDIMITEVEAGYIKAATSYNTVQVRLPANIAWSANPTVEVLEGNLVVDRVSNDGARMLTITIERANTSSTPAKIKISNARVDIDRTVAEGSYNFGIMGTALNRIHNSGQAALIAQNALDTAATNAIVSFKGMTVITPAPSEEGLVKPVTMTVGSSVFIVDGVEVQMDVAPYVKGGRTFFPVRFVANALNISDDNVVWDGAMRTVTIFKANRIVQVTIGSQTLLVNGIPMTMDTAPEIFEGRTMLPIRAVGQALGVVVDWDGATQTVTLR